MNRGRRLPIKLEAVRNDAVGDFAIAEEQRLVHSIPVERQIGRLTHPQIMPGRFGIPLLGKIDPVRRLSDDRLEGEPRGAANAVGKLAADRIGDVDLAALQCREPRQFIGDDPHHQALDARGLAPIAVEGFEHELDAGVERDEFIRPGADRRLLEPLVADFLDVFLRDDPARAARGRVEGHKIGPLLLELEPNVPGVGRLDGGHLVVEQIVRGALVTLERELDVLGGDGLAIVEFGILAQYELVAEAVFGGRP